MVFRNNFVAVVKVNGKILRENKDIISLPFNSEYSILLKNLETKKALVKITVDGKDVLDGNSLVLNPNSEMELEGFMKGMIARNKFKKYDFIDFLCEDAEEFNFKNQYDRVMVFNAFPHFPNPKALIKNLAKAVAAPAHPI